MIASALPQAWRWSASTRSGELPGAAVPSKLQKCATPATSVVAAIILANADSIASGSRGIESDPTVCIAVRTGSNANARVTRCFERTRERLADTLRVDKQQPRAARPGHGRGAVAGAGLPRHRVGNSIRRKRHRLPLDRLGHFRKRDPFEPCDQRAGLVDHLDVGDDPGVARIRVLAEHDVTRDGSGRRPHGMQPAHRLRQVRTLAAWVGPGSAARIGCRHPSITVG